jgi:sialidase-1
VCPTDGTNNLRNSEGSVIDLKDGSLLLAYSRFRAGSGSDYAPSDIASKQSSDGGRTWTKSRGITHGQTNGNVLSVSLLRLGRGDIALLYARGTFQKGTGYTSGNMDDVSLHYVSEIMRTSSDEGRTWSDERVLNPPGEHGQIPLNDCAKRLSTGRLLLPNYHYFSLYSYHPLYVQPLLSDDDGRTWYPSRFRIGLQMGDSAGQLSESAVVERADGSLLMLCRTATGFLYRCESRDGGETWSRPESSGLPSTQSPMSLARVPHSGDILVIWNQISQDEANQNFPRHRLTAAVSSDGGRTWRHRRNLESMNDRAYIPIEEAGPRQTLGKLSKEEQAQRVAKLGLRDKPFRQAEYPSLIFVGGERSDHV